MIKNKKGFDMPFSWIFAVIAGAVIILIAIYATTSIVRTGKEAYYSQAAMQIANYLNPVVNGVTSAFATKIDFKKNTRIYLTCQTFSSKSPYFGREAISFSEESGLLQKWTLPGAEIGRYNKYIFSDNVTEGKTLYIFSKPFYAGFRVDDLVMISMDKYCFVGTPETVKNEIVLLAPYNINLSANVKFCDANSKKVCFGFDDKNCDMFVSASCTQDECLHEYETGYVYKEDRRMDYYGNLMYAAIFSSPDIYECNLARLGKKILELSEIYNGKIEIVKEKGCDSLIGVYMNAMTGYSANLNSQNIRKIWEESKLMDEVNCRSKCEIYTPAPEAC